MNLDVAEQVRLAEKVTVTIPGLVKPLAPYQQKGVSWLYSIRNGILADDVGLGKTVSALATAALLKDKKQLGNVYIACLGGHERHWVNQIREWLPGVFEEIGIASGIIKGRRRTRRERAALYEESPRILISNYHLLRNDIDLLEKYRWGLVILDEATVFKNYDTKLFDAVKRLTSSAHRVIGLTATPFEKNLGEFYAIQDVLGLDLFGSVADFQNNFEIITWERAYRSGRYYPKHKGYRNLELFKEILTPYVLRREEDDVGLELPEVRTKNIYLEMAPSQLAFYKQLASEFKETSSLGTFSRLVQTCDSPWVSTLSDDQTSPKLDELIRLLDNEFLGYKVVVFARWHRTVDLIGQKLSRLGIGWLPFTGKQDTDVREDNKDKFINDPFIRVLITTTAGEKGVDGLQVAKGLIAFNQLHNPQRMRQVVGRVRRLGSPHKSILSINLMMENSVEESLYDLMMSRAELFDAIFDSTSTVDLFTDSTDKDLIKEAIKVLKDKL